MVRLPAFLVAPLALVTVAAHAAPADRDGERVVERAVLLMRHGVRAPLSDPAMPAGTAAATWPAWPVPRAHLTPHGRAAVAALGVADRTAIGLRPAPGCPDVATVRIVADNDQRTIETGRAWAAGFAPGCDLSPTALPAGEVDPVFAPVEAMGAGFDTAAARRAVERRLPRGGFATLDARTAPLRARLDTILCGRAGMPNCGVSRRPTALRPVRPGREPALVGAIADGAKAAQILTLEYADGMAAPGWGRLRSGDVAMLGALRAVAYDVVYRTPYVARAFGGPTLRRMLDGIEGVDAPRLTVMIGHDSNIAAVAGLLDLHWRVPGFAADDPPPSGAIVMQLIRDRRGHRFVRMIFRSPTLDQIRAGGALSADGATARPIAIPGCAPTPFACPLDRFRRLVSAVLAP
ncbi:histidine-type phosphatase [Sphingomonas sp.]|uniref:histidine-type phosphatase n=1 Tax=Sphingomonas sp. TaxID=28214 RepID=UPI001EB3A239|nr:histidine-type phosphatase [Sphingomonas sp.]MBX3594809.1 histidine-type phosphatase [Sphingomonas sp.]